MAPADNIHDIGVRLLQQLTIVGARSVGCRWCGRTRLLRGRHIGIARHLKHDADIRVRGFIPREGASPVDVVYLFQVKVPQRSHVL